MFHTDRVIEFFLQLCCNGFVLNNVPKAECLRWHDVHEAGQKGTVRLVTPELVVRG